MASRASVTSPTAVVRFCGFVAPPFDSADFSAGSIWLLNSGPSFASYCALVSGCPLAVVAVAEADDDDDDDVELDFDEPPQPASARASAEAPTAAPERHLEPSRAPR